MPVYLIGEEDSGFCRMMIGIAKDMEKRRGNLQTGPHFGRLCFRFD